MKQLFKNLHPQVVELSICIKYNFHENSLFIPNISLSHHHLYDKKPSYYESNVLK